jgi:hypothetical protein
VILLGIGGFVGMVGALRDHQVAASAGDRQATPAPTTSVVLEPPGPPAGQVVVTRQMADRVLRAHWPVHEEALRNDNLDLLATLSGGSARRWEISSVACDCLNVSTVRPLLEAVYFVPRQTTYPARFIVEVRTRYSSGGEGVELLTFSRSGPRARWLVIESSFFGPRKLEDPAVLILPDTTADGFTKPVSPAVQARARSVARQFAAVWQETKNTGRIPDSAEGFVLQGQTGNRLTALAEHRQNSKQRNGLYGHFTFFTKTTDPLVVVPTAHNFVLACQPVHGNIEYTPGRDRVVYQDPGLKNWGPLVKPGNYRAMTVYQEWQTCFAVYDDPAKKVFVFNQDIGGGASKPRS